MDFNVRISTMDNKVVFRTAAQFRTILAQLFGEESADLHMLNLDAGKILKLTIKGQVLKIRKV